MNKQGHDRPASQWIHRYWVEIRHLRDGSACTLPLRPIRLIHLGGRKGAPPKPGKQILRLEDDSAVIEAKDIDELAVQLRRRYPDETHERRLRWERDLEAERRRADSLRSLIEFLAEAAVNDILREQAAGCATHQGPP